MLLPLDMLWKVSLALKLKLGLAAVFSLAPIAIILAIVAATQVSRKKFMDGVLLAVGSIIESTVCK